MKKIIIMLSAKRCGSTAIFNLFQKHSDVKILHKNQKIVNWEPQFWFFASKAINGESKEFNERVLDTLNLEKNFIKDKYSEEDIFNIFNLILDKYGPTIFDKSPQYLGSKESILLLMKYKKKNPEIKIIIFAFIRNPLDAITSQHELWRHYTKENSLVERERDWLNKYKHFEEIKKDLNIKLYKYEEFCSDPKNYTKNLMEYCELNYSDDLCSHLEKKSSGRYFITPFKSIKNWVVGKDLLKHMEKYGYSNYNQNTEKFDKLKIYLISLKRMIVPFFRRFF